MSKAYRITKRTITLGSRKGEVVYNVSPVSYGTLTTDDAARQIAAESTASPGDVKNVLDRYAYFVAENLKKGYTIEMLGFGYMNLRFRTKPGVSNQAEATAKQVISLLPDFTPSFKVVNKRRIYDLLPDQVTLVKLGSLADGTLSGGSESDSPGGSDTTGGSDSSGNTGTEGTTPDSDLEQNPFG